ncbi:hypothetical protein OSH08_00640 [Kaistia geumhonensis]|uniref:Uncharacterized protein n=1 Tax=Kaistia geumhonensis TaxID=410839 RepID=A0ABU0M8L2_9HYPH|nr:hypothetical protein [Kaistia geumhonensis]MCX5477489.1 hypothetical protein [Kaistia geumhonensis]MDQ0517304.1 hypothetical protein [Kaistia geumhonensis]
MVILIPSFASLSRAAGRFPLREVVGRLISPSDPKGETMGHGRDDQPVVAVFGVVVTVFGRAGACGRAPVTAATRPVRIALARRGAAIGKPD